MPLSTVRSISLSETPRDCEHRLKDEAALQVEGVDIATLSVRSDTYMVFYGNLNTERQSERTISLDLCL